MNHLVIGYIAGSFTTAAWLPQLRKTWRLRSAEEISWGYLATFGTGVALWLYYGIVRHDGSLIATNGATLALVLSLVLLKVATRHKDSERLRSADAV